MLHCFLSLQVYESDFSNVSDKRVGTELVVTYFDISVQPLVMLASKGQIIDNIVTQLLDFFLSTNLNK